MNTPITKSFLKAALLAGIGALTIACRQEGPAPQVGSRPKAETQAESGKPVLKRDNPCSLLLHREVEETVGFEVPMREIVDEKICHYEFGRPLQTATGHAPRAGSEETEAAVNDFASAFAGGRAVLAVRVEWEDGRTMALATRVAGKLLASEMTAFEPLAGIGDEAWLGLMASTLVFTKGKTGVELDLRMVPGGREKGIRLAKLIAGRI